MKTKKPKHAPTKGQQPEALATFAAAARHSGKKPDDVGLHATRSTAPLREDLEREEKAAAAILNENATGHDQGGKAAAKALADPTRTVKH
jgi:hypothetical protein